MHIAKPLLISMTYDITRKIVQYAKRITFWSSLGIVAQNIWVTPIV